MSKLKNPNAKPKIGMVRLPHGEGLALPAYESRQAAGMDLRAACAESQPIVLASGARTLIATGFIFEIADGFEGQVRPRSGLAFRNGVTCLNTPGTIDSDYRGEVMILLINHGDEDFVITRGMRIAQMVIAPVVQADIEETDLATLTDRGSGGFGSTGV